MSKPEGTDQARNKLITALPATERERICSRMETVPLTFKQPLGKANQRMDWVYFPNSGVVSMVTTMQDAQVIEVGTIGNEGIVGLPVFLGADTIPMDAFVQVPGEAERIRADAFRDVVVPGTHMHELLQRYIQAMFVFTAQSEACNRAHGIEQRCSRWILLTHDRVPGDEFSLTQEFLGQMLGVRRASVNWVAQTLQQAGLISYVRGNVTILDREGLEKAACECYQVIRREFDKIVD